MATDINEIYKKYPCAKHQMLDNIKYWDEKHKEDDEPCFDVWMHMANTQDEIYNFLEDLEAHDMFLLKRNEITPAQEKHNRGVGRSITKKYLDGYEDASMWYRLNSMDWGTPDDESEKNKI